MMIGRKVVIGGKRAASFSYEEVVGRMGVIAQVSITYFTVLIKMRRGGKEELDTWYIQKEDVTFLDSHATNEDYEFLLKEKD